MATYSKNIAERESGQHLQVTLVRSGISAKPKTRGTLRALGLRKIGDTVEHEDSPQLQGMLRMVSRLVDVKEAANG